MEERRSFDYNGKVYFINTPTAEDIKQADWVYSKVYTKSLMEGIMTQSELTDILTRRGVIGPDYEKRRLELEEELSTKIMELAAAKTVEEKQIKALEVAQAREELFKWVQRLSGPMSNTCEQIADDSRLEYLTSCMVEYEDGTRVWKSYEEFLSEKDQNFDSTNYLYSRYYRPYGSSWGKQDDPCDVSYYGTDHFSEKNFLASNIGLTVKSSHQNQYIVFTRDLVTAEMLGDVKLQFFSFQNQLLTETTTDNEGKAVVTLDKEPFVVVAQWQNQRSGDLWVIPDSG